MTEPIRGDTTAAAMLPVEAAGDGAGFGTGVAGDKAKPCVPAEIAAAGSEVGEVKGGDTAGDAEVMRDGRGDAAMLEGVDAVAGGGDIGGKVGGEAGLSVVIALGDAVTGAGDAVTGVGDAAKELGVVAIELGAAAVGDTLTGLGDAGTAAGNDGMELADGKGVEPGEVVVGEEDGVDAVMGDGASGVDSGGEGRVDVGGD